MTHNCPKPEKYLFPGISGCIFASATGGPSESSCSEGSEYVWQRGVGSQKCLVIGNFQSVPRYRTGIDQTGQLWIIQFPPPLYKTPSNFV